MDEEIVFLKVNFHVSAEQQPKGKIFLTSSS